MLKKIIVVFSFFLLSYCSVAQVDSEKDYKTILDTATIGTEAYFQAYMDFLNANLYADASINIDSLSKEYIKLTKQFNNSHYQIKGMYARAIALANIEKHDASLKLLQETLTISQELKEHKLSAQILTFTGIVHIYASDNYEEAIPFIEESNIICEAHDLKKRLSQNYKTLGYLYSGGYEQQGLDPALQQTPEFQNYLVKAIDYFDKAVKIAEVLRDSNQIDVVLSEKVNLLLHQKKYKEAIEIATTLLNKEQLKRNKALLKDNKSDLFVISIYKMHIVLARAQFGLNNKKAAYEHLNTAIRIIKELGEMIDLEYVYHVRHEFAIQEQDYKTAYEYFKKSNEVKDSIWTSEKQLAFEELKVTHETEKKEQENLLLTNEKTALEFRNKWISYTAIIALLGLGILAFLFVKVRKQNTLIDSQRISLNQSLQEKEVLLKEIHHRVKNNLQIISNLMAKQARKTSNDTVKKMMQEGQDRVQSMALIHQNLYQSDSLSSINIKSYLEELTQVIAQTQAVEGKKIDIHIAVDDLQLPIDTAIPVGLILNELITNSFKYAFPDRAAGEISIGFKKTSDNKISLEVKDNGVGIANDLEHRKSKSLGLNLVRGLVEQLDGTMNLIGSSQGTQFALVF